VGTIKAGEGEWIVVCDGRKALILENVGDRRFPSLKTREVLQHPDAPTSEQGTDTPGRVHASTGQARSSVDQTDWHDEAERVFLARVAERLNAAIVAGETHALHIVAAPRALGMVRSGYSPAVRRAVKIEVDKDLVKLPVHEIERQLLA
jgi:protein required for attachment to host cells